MFEVRSLKKDPLVNEIISYGMYPTEKKARDRMMKLSTSKFRNSDEMRALGFELVQYTPTRIAIVGATK
jgi:hypothetical protein